MKAANERPRISSAQTLLPPPQHESCALFCPQLTTVICTCTTYEPEKVVLLEQAQTLAPMVHRRTSLPLQKSFEAPPVHLTFPPAQPLRRRVGFEGGSQVKRPKWGPWRSCMAPMAPTQGRMNVGAFLRFLQNKGVGSSNLFRDKSGKKLLVLWGCDHHTAKCDEGSLRSRLEHKGVKSASVAECVTAIAHRAPFLLQEVKHSVRCSSSGGTRGLDPPWHSPVSNSSSCD
jgi:hypothetical protein